MRQEALQLLRQALGQPTAEFRNNQWDCISALLNRRRMLVVQRTGWGKSMIYFLATRLLRNQGYGLTLLISPLLALMRNQIQAANRIGIVAESINSSNVEEWNEIEQRLTRGEIDILLISPERLANEKFRKNVLQHIANRVGLFVVDEAHCISDWGHDFRPDYKRIVRILQALPSNIPVLATTATANNRVVNDVARQLGDLEIVRGPLIRESLKLQNIWLRSPASRMAWLTENLPEIPGSGIIYTLTKRDSERLAEWLRLNGINVLPYHSDVEDRPALEGMLLNNDVKALVATVALGMGFDKPDLGFVIHFQRPGSVVHYYQQVGRAGRAVEEAYGILLSGEEDKEITDYFIRTAFPPQIHVEQVLTALEGAEEGLSIWMMQQSINLTFGDISKVLKLLSVEDPSPVLKEGSKWFRTPINYQLDVGQIRQLGQLRHKEQAEMLEYMQSNTCLMKYLAEALDDSNARECGKCAGCRGEPLLSEYPSEKLVNKAAIFLRRSHQAIEPRKRWPPSYQFEIYGWKGLISEDLRAEEGRALALWGDAGWGEMVQHGKYRDRRFGDELIDGCVEMIQSWNPEPYPDWLTCVPSLNHPELVPGFARRLAERLGIPFIDCIKKVKQNAEQKTKQNSVQQARNLDGVFEIADNIPQAPAFLVDDMVDSQWTMTVLSALLKQHGCEEVFPLALALNSLG
ncbi:MAG: RecQ family ATP-dependent DNA helicase [Candidatus Electryonea clarkiae]|nr:RecQ family ATP-dependent DNA helicase [Candidatus Electryonea clarkiae]MDP8286532.1 RecQ family ATP-dependent DNA helicase [Candidatus Electryonea clarkiae]